MKNVKDNVVSNSRSNRGGRNAQSKDEGTYLADNKTREIFASGVVEVLDYDRASAPRPIMNSDGGGRRGGHGNNDRGGRRGGHGRR